MKKNFKKSAILSIIFALVLSILPFGVVFGGALKCSTDAGGCPFDMNLGNYSPYYATKPNLNFQTKQYRVLYALTIPNVTGKLIVTETGTKLWINVNDLVRNDIVPLPSQIDVPSSEALPNVRQARQFVTDTLSSYRWIIKNDPDVKDDEWYKSNEVDSLGNPVSYISYDFLSEMYGFINTPKPFYWQGQTYSSVDTFRYVFQGNNATLKLDNYLVKNRDSKTNIITVDLRYTLRAEYNQVAEISVVKLAWFNHYTNVVLSKYSTSAKKTLLDSTAKTTTSVLGALDVIEDEDDLYITLLSYFNSNWFSKDYNNTAFTVDRKNVGVFGTTFVPTYLFNIYVNYDDQSNSLTLGKSGGNAIEFTKDEIVPESSMGSAPVMSIKMQYKNGEYVLAVPILNAIRFYEDVENAAKRTKVGNLNWSDVSTALKNAFINEIAGKDSNSGIKKIIAEINNQYGTSYNPSTEANRLANEAYTKIMAMLKAEYENKAVYDQHTISYGDQRQKILYGDRLLPSSYSVRKEIMDTTTDAYYAKTTLDPKVVLKVRDLYDYNLTIQDYVDGYFNEKWRNMVAIPFKIKQPDDIEIKLTDTGISPKVNSVTEGSGLDEYENLNRTYSSYALPGKTYTATYTITNHSDLPVTNFVARYYVVNTQPSPYGTPYIYATNTLGMFYGTTYTFTNPDKIITAYGSQIDSATIGSTPTILKAFLDPGETYTGTFQWTMPNDGINPKRDPIYLYVTVAETIDKNTPMTNDGTATEPNWSAKFIREKLKYYTNSTDGSTAVSFSRNQIMTRDGEVNHDEITIASRLDSAITIPPDDPFAPPPSELVQEQDFLRFATITTKRYEEVPVWIEDGYWVPLEIKTYRFKRTQWLVQ
ncbi:MAG: hypothetical protein ACH0QD_04530 [Tepidibacillus sp.]